MNPYEKIDKEFDNKFSVIYNGENYALNDDTKVIGNFNATEYSNLQDIKTFLHLKISDAKEQAYIDRGVVEAGIKDTMLREHEKELEKVRKEAYQEGLTFEMKAHAEEMEVRFKEGRLQGLSESGKLTFEPSLDYEDGRKIGFREGVESVGIVIREALKPKIT